MNEVPPAANWTLKKKVKPGVPVALGDVAPEIRQPIVCDARLFGAQVPFGTITLVSGEPGCGKTTALFDVCGSVKKAGGVALYVSSEESLAGLKAKAKAWNAHPGILVAEAKTLSDALRAIKSARPDFFVIDSINDLVNDANVNRELVENTEAIIASVRKRKNVGVIIGHINKEGGVSGPEQVEHAVDSVVFIEVENESKAEKRKSRDKPFKEAVNVKARRIVTIRKCRYGPDGLSGYYMLNRDGITWLESRVRV